MMQEFNSQAKYTRITHIILLIFKVIYFPLYYVIDRKLKKIKFMNLIKLVQNHKENLFRENGYTVKFTCSSDQTLCYFDFVNYNQSILNWQNQTKFPLSLVLAGEGTFLYPLHLDFEDPQYKSLFFSINKYDQEAEQENENFLQREEIHQFESFFRKFNLIAKTIDYATNQKEFQS